MSRRCDVSRSWLRFGSPGLDGVAVPLFEAQGALDGPTLTVLGGVHGCEYVPIAAVRAFMRGLDPRVLRGRIRALPIVDLKAYLARSPFISPADNKNLNRCFPGDPDGSVTEQLAHEVFTTCILGSDAVVDAHAGDLVEALTPFTLYDESPVDEAARALAEAYGLPVVIRQPGGECEVRGSTSAAAAEAGIPAIIAEAGDGGRLDPASVSLHLVGLRSVAAQLGMLPGPPPDRPALAARHFDRFIWIRSAVGGWWDPAPVLGQDVSTGEDLGRMLDLFGDEIERIASPADGVVVFQTTTPAVDDNGLVCALAAGEDR